MLELKLKRYRPFLKQALKYDIIYGLKIYKVAHPIKKFEILRMFKVSVQ
jgi:hypothetical protein